MSPLEPIPPKGPRRPSTRCWGPLQPLHHPLTADEGRWPCRRCSDNSNQPGPGPTPPRISRADSDFNGKSSQHELHSEGVDTTLLLSRPGITSARCYNILPLQQ